MRWSRRRWWLMAAAALALLLGQFAVAPAKADRQADNANDLILQCYTSGGTPDAEYDSDIGLATIYCDFPGGAGWECWIFADGSTNCFDNSIPGGPGSGSPETGTYFPGPTVAPGPAGGAVVTGRPGENAPPENGSPPTPTPRTHVGGITIAPITGAAANRVNPTPTPTKGKVGAGGISIAPINGVKAPPATTGNPATPPSSGIYLNAWTCPAGDGGDQAQLQSSCRDLHTINFELTGPNLQQTTVGGIAAGGLPAGSYQVKEEIPPGYGITGAFCHLGAPHDPPPPQSFTPVAVSNGVYTFTLPANQAMYCNWYNVPLANAATPLAVTAVGAATPVP